MIVQRSPDFWQQRPTWIRNIQLPFSYQALVISAHTDTIYLSDAQQTYLLVNVQVTNHDQQRLPQI